jgi:hypothetical protein
VDASEREDIPRQPSPEGSSPEQGSPHGRESSASASRYKGQTVWVTNITKIVGLGMGAGEAFLQDHPRREIVLLCVVFVVGAQAVENIILRGIDRLFDRASD